LHLFERERRGSGCLLKFLLGASGSASQSSKGLQQRYKGNLCLQGECLNSFTLFFSLLITA
jgi:hypothetical protein